MVIEVQFFQNFIFSCKICGMNYHQHMMHGHGTIRTHLYTHFGPDLNKMVIETPEGKFKCPEPGCGYEKAEKGNFRDHLGVFHKYLDVFVDQYNPPPKKKLSLKDYNKQRKNSGPERQKVETIVAAKQLKPIVLLAPVKENLTMCCICDIWDSRDAIRKHYLDQHFRYVIVFFSVKLIYKTFIICLLFQSRVG